MDATSFKESDLYSIGGLIVVIPMITIGLAKLFGPWSPKFAHAVVFALTFVIGFAVKLTVKTAFVGFTWVGLLVGLVIAAIISAQAYDTGSHFVGANGASAGSMGNQPPPQDAGGTQKV